MRKLKNIEIDENNIPKHIGFIMDGNGRWAKRRGLPRTAGHREGAFALKRVCEACRNFKIKTITVYALSTENLMREKKEVDYIFELIEEFISKELSNAEKNGVKINIIGDLNHERIPLSCKEVILNAMEQTKNNTNFILNIALVYGGRDEITRAVNKILASGKKSITKEEFSNYLDTAGQEDPDLIVRASGEQRISNFLLWQLAYSEFYFPKEYWPEFNKDLVKKCILEYQTRTRKFGKVKEEK
ncbi:MAG: polyprenyl diphosphate synthase [Christensenellales bacterium]